MSTSRDNRKCEIMSVGYIDSDGIPQYWVFSGEGSKAAALTITADGMLYGGWSVEQLREIASSTVD